MNISLTYRNMEKKFPYKTSTWITIKTLLTRKAGRRQHVLETDIFSRLDTTNAPELERARELCWELIQDIVVNEYKLGFKIDW